MTNNEAPRSDNQQEKDDTMMTPEDRVSWLRERGVHISTPEERKASKIAEAMRQADLLQASDDKLDDQDKIAFVRIPADTSLPLEQRYFARPKPAVTNSTTTTPTATWADGDYLLEYLKPAFQSPENEGQFVDISLLQQQQQETASTLLSSAGPDVPTVSEKTLRQVAEEGSVEYFTLVHPTPANRFLGIRLYLDEVGLLKRLPLNTRASNWAAQAGFDPPPIFYGDVYAGRIQQQAGTGILTNQSFWLGPDTAPDAAWRQSAVMDNLTYQTEMNRITGRSGGAAQQQPLHAGQDKFKQEDGFQWSQSEEELEVRFSCPAETVAKDIQVQFRPLSVQVRVNNGNTTHITLFEKVEVDGCTWTLEKGDAGRQLVLTLEKVESAFWPRIKD